MNFRIFVSVLLTLTLLNISCKEETTQPQNQKPKIESLSVNPSTIAVNEETTLTCVATDPDGDNLTVSWTAPSGTFPNGNVGTSVKWKAPNNIGIYSITATVSDGKDTDKDVVSVSVEIAGTAPEVPTLSSPSNGATNASLPLTLIWNSSNGATEYTLQVSMNNNFTNIVYNQNGLTGTSQQITGLNNSTKYYWRVSATNSYGTSGWSSVWSYTTVGTAPSAPLLYQPASGATNVSIPPSLFWDPSIGATSYTLQVSLNSNYTSFVYNQSGLTSTSQQVSGLNYSTTYFWRVSAANSNGTSGWSSVWNFTTTGGAAPDAPTLSSPANGETNLALPPTLSWHTSSGVTSFTLQVSTSSNFASFVYNQSGLTDTSQQVTGLNNSTTYYWRVNATNSFGTSYWSSVWNFTTASGGSGGGQPCPGIPTVIYEGKTYNTVLIEDQCWLKQNLDVGTMIQGNNEATNNGVIEKYCYNNDPNNCNTYGGLYQWDEAMQYVTNEGTQGICPPGWHVPTYEDFYTLRYAVNYDGNALKAIGQGSGGGAGTNTSGFSALLAGRRDYDGYFYYLGSGTSFWSSTEYNSTSAYTLGLSPLSNNIYLLSDNKEYGLSVRCLKD